MAVKWEREREVQDKIVGLNHLTTTRSGFINPLSGRASLHSCLTLLPPPSLPPAQENTTTCSPQLTWEHMWESWFLVQCGDTMLREKAPNSTRWFSHNDNTFWWSHNPSFGLFGLGFFTKPLGIPSVNTMIIMGHLKGPTSVLHWFIQNAWQKWTWQQAKFCVTQILGCQMDLAIILQQSVMWCHTPTLTQTHTYTQWVGMITNDRPLSAEHW